MTERRKKKENDSYQTAPIFDSLLVLLYFSLFQSEYKTHRAIKVIWSEQNVVELLSAEHEHLADFLPPHTWKCAEGGPGLCRPPPQTRSRVRAHPALTDGRKGSGADLRRPPSLPATDPIHHPSLAGRCCAALTDTWNLRFNVASANKAVDVDDRAASLFLHVWQRWQIYRRPQIVSGSVSGWQK